MSLATDVDLSAKQIAELTSVDALTGWLAKLGYETAARTSLTPASLGMNPEAAGAFKKIELLSEDSEQLLRIVFAQTKSLTTKSRNDLVRAFSKNVVDHMLILTADFDTLEFVLLDEEKRSTKGPARADAIKTVPKTITINRRSPSRLDVRTLRRFTLTTSDGIAQFDKLNHVFDHAAYHDQYFLNLALFSDYYLKERLREQPAWRENPAPTYTAVSALMKNAAEKFIGKDEATLRKELLEPIFQKLGFHAAAQKVKEKELAKPDYLLKDAAGNVISAAFTYPWDRYLDGPDSNDGDTPDENPGACVVAALDEGPAEWIIVTNGRLWRLYSKHAHARSTNFYEVDLVEVLASPGDSDPNEAFRYWWLFFRAEAYRPQSGEPIWLDAILQGCREYAKRLGDRLKARIFEMIFPHLAQGFLEDRRLRLGIKKEPNEAELEEIFEATLTLLYRLLFVLYAESRDLLPIREPAYAAASLKKIKEEIADKAGVAESEVPERVAKAYSDRDANFYERLQKLFHAMNEGDSALNVPAYNGGLFNTKPGDVGAHEQQIARFLRDHKIPDRYLAKAIDRLSRDPDERTLALGFLDYKTLEVRHLGSIYEGLLEFKLKVAPEDLTTKADKSGEKYISLSAAVPKRGRAVEVVVEKGKVYLSNDKAERKASGSYYTPDPIVEYIVANTVGPVLDEKLKELLPEFRKVRKTFDNELQKAKAYPSPEVRSGKTGEREWALLQCYNHQKALVEKLFDLKVLDPAMGSGHFLVEAVDFITDRLLKFLIQFPVNPVAYALECTRTSILTSLAEQGVTVDPKALTDIHLLKRHVLKRCIYGVDLNPMAVELAKVSLWLDAFTLGAPLSFLDHHLRNGNSLIGATFDELESDTSRGLFSIDYGKLTRAMARLFEVNRSSDATAAEAGVSKKNFENARALVDAYRPALDAVCAEVFQVPSAGVYATAAIYALRDDDGQFPPESQALEQRVGPQIRALAGEHRFLHYQMEFPEVFFDFVDTDQRQIRRKNAIAKGSAGFDCVVGNPPFVRMELIKPVKPFLKRRFECHSERADLFIYFYEQAVKLLRRGGRTAFIASSTWTKTKAGEGLRKFLQKETTLESYLDFGDLPVFEEATTYPCILVEKREHAPPDHQVKAAVVQDLGAWDFSKVMDDAIRVPQVELEVAGWHFEDRAKARLREKIRAAGVPLKDYCGSPLYGIKTGLNEAFVVDAFARDRFVAADPKSAEILKPFLEGKDLKAWRVEWRGLYLIYAHHGIKIDRYPAIKEYLRTFKPRLEARATSESHEWYELQQPQHEYEKYMLKPKIIWPQITNQARFVYDDRNFYLNNKIYFLTGESDELQFLQGILGSQMAWYFVTTIATPKMNNYYELIAGVMDRIPIARSNAKQKASICNLAKKLSDPKATNTLELQRELDDLVCDLYGLTADERKIVAGLTPASSSAPVDEGE